MDDMRGEGMDMHSFIHSGRREATSEIIVRDGGEYYKVYIHKLGRIL